MMHIRKVSSFFLETMQEMMRQLTVLTKNVASFYDLERHRNPYGPRPYWNNNRGPERDPNRRRLEYPQNAEKRNVDWCDENDEEPTNTSHPDEQPGNINFMNDLSYDDEFGRILVEEEIWEQEEEIWEQ